MPKDMNRFRAVCKLDIAMVYCMDKDGYLSASANLCSRLIKEILNEGPAEDVLEYDSGQIAKPTEDEIYHETEEIMEKEVEIDDQQNSLNRSVRFEGPGLGYNREIAESLRPGVTVQRSERPQRAD